MSKNFSIKSATNLHQFLMMLRPISINAFCGRRIVTEFMQALYEFYAKFFLHTAVKLLDTISDQKRISNKIITLFWREDREKRRRCWNKKRCTKFIDSFVNAKRKAKAHTGMFWKSLTALKKPLWSFVGLKLKPNFVFPGLALRRKRRYQIDKEISFDV